MPDRISKSISSIFMIAVLSALWACSTNSNIRGSAGAENNIVGAWFVKAPEAPFPYHMFVFNADGTMQQTNPDAGDANTSDSNGMGMWVRHGAAIIGKFEEVTADRITRKFASRGEITFEVHVYGNTFSGNATARFYDANGKLLKGPLKTPLQGERVRLASP